MIHFPLKPKFSFELNFTSFDRSYWL